jgi:hypothetical protein
LVAELAGRVSILSGLPHGQPSNSVKLITLSLMRVSKH